MDHLQIVQTLCSNGFDTFIVGGAPRDILIGKEPKDIDIVTKATPEEISALFSNTKSVGKSYGIILVGGFEVATFRSDRYSELLDAKNCVISFAKTIQEDVSRRDLTINAMAMCELTGELVDEHGGQEDLKKRIIRFVGDPILRIQEDPDRILRACRFLAQIEGRFAKETFNALSNTAYYVEKYLAPERIRLEILKAMHLKVPSLFFSALHLIGALKYIFPEMDDCFHHPHGVYHKETVGEHILQAGDNISPRFPLVRLAAFLHDIGKPQAFREYNGESFIGHEYVGGRVTEKALKRLKFSNEEVATVSKLVHCHMLQCRGLKRPAARRLQKKLAERGVDPRSFLRLKLADRLANMSRDKNKISPIKDLIKNAGIRGFDESVPLNVTDLALSGGELIQIFKLSPGPIVGKLQKFLLGLVVDLGEGHNTAEFLKEQAELFLQEVLP